MEDCGGIPRGEEKTCRPDYERMYEECRVEMNRLLDELEKSRELNKAQRGIILKNERELDKLRGQLEVVYMIFGNRR